MYYTESPTGEFRIPNAYDGVAFREDDKAEYIQDEEKPNRNPWEVTPKIEEEILPPPTVGEVPPPKEQNAESVFAGIKKLFPVGEMIKGLHFPSLISAFLPKPREKPTTDPSAEEENLMLLLVSGILFFSPQGDKKAALLLLLVYVLT